MPKETPSLRQLAIKKVVKPSIVKAIHKRKETGPRYLSNALRKVDSTLKKSGLPNELKEEAKAYANKKVDSIAFRSKEHVRPASVRAYNKVQKNNGKPPEKHKEKKVSQYYAYKEQKQIDKYLDSKFPKK